MTDELEKLENIGIARKLLHNLTDLPDDLIEELKNGVKEEFDNRQEHRKEKTANVYTNKDDLNNNKKEPITLEALPPPTDPETIKNQRIFGAKLYELSRIFSILGDNVTKRNYFAEDKNIQKECILGIDAFIKYIEPLYNDTFIGDWKDLLMQAVERLKHDKHWSEDPDWIREVKYQIFDNGEVRYKYSRKFKLTESIIRRLVNVIMITDCSYFSSGLFMNNYASRYQAALKWRQKRSDDRKGKRKE